MREQMHRKRGHRHVRFAARHAFLGGLRVQRAVCLLVPREIRRRRVLFPALGTCIPRPRVTTLTDARRERRSPGRDGRARLPFGTTVAYEKRFIGVRDCFPRRLKWWLDCRNWLRGSRRWRRRNRSNWGCRRAQIEDGVSGAQIFLSSE